MMDPKVEVVAWLLLVSLVLASSELAPPPAPPPGPPGHGYCDYCHDFSGVWSVICSGCSSVEGPVMVSENDSGDTLTLWTQTDGTCSPREQGAYICRGPLHSAEQATCCFVQPESTCRPITTSCKPYNLVTHTNYDIQDQKNSSYRSNSSQRHAYFNSATKNATAQSPSHSPTLSPSHIVKRKINRNIFIIGGLAGGGLILLVVCVFLLTRRKKHLQKARWNSSDRAQILLDIPGVQPPTVFSFKELKAATKSFAESKLLGGGGFSTVYQGKLPDGRIVAVKRLNQGNKQGIQQFQNEVTILSKVRHPNLVQLLGYCLEGRDLLLVYEYVLNGTLADHLHGDKGNGLSMETRLSIALDTAHALAYLHFYVNPPIYHRDVKSSNILLDKDFRAKVADFGLSRLTHLDGSNISTAPQGTPGYLDPDYHESYQLTDKSDVYSFGVVLLELVSRKRAVDMTRDKKEINLASLALARIHSGALHELFDPDLSVKYWKLLTRLVEVAFRCLAPEKDDRPNMIEVVAELEQLSSMGVMSFSSRRKVKLEHQTSSGELKKQSSSNRKLEDDSPTSVQIKWPSTHTSPNNSRSEVL